MKCTEQFPTSRRTPILSLAACALLALLPTVARATPTVINGSFEIPDATIGPTYYAGETFGGWTVEYGNINHVGSSLPGWQAASGNQSVDLTGQFQGPGAIYQDLTTPEQPYLLRFAMAGNPYGGPAIKMMEIWWASTLVDTLAFDTTGYSASNMGWVYHEYPVTALEPITRLNFRSLTDGFYGPALDDVSVTAVSARVPVPSAILLAGLGAGVVGWLRQRERL